MGDKNPFKSKPNNSRFSKDIFFSDDEIKNQDKPTEKRKNLEPSELSGNVNTFLVDKSKDIRPINNIYKTRDQGKNISRKQTFFSEPKEIKPLTFDITNEEFPSLSPSVSVASISNTFDEKPQGKNFLDAINTITIVEEEYDKIKPGWIVIYKDNTDNQIKITEGEPTKYQLKEKEKSIVENNLNFIMEQVHHGLSKMWDKNIVLYDSIHGEGAYEEVYYLPPVYDDFYKYEDSDTEEDDEFDGNELDDYSDRGWTSDYE